MDVNVTVICTAADKAAGQSLCTDLGDYGPSCFSIPLSTTEGVTDPALATHWGMSGIMPEAEAHGLDISLNPMVKVFSNDDGTDFMAHLAMCTPPLYRIYEQI